MKNQSCQKIQRPIITLFIITTFIICSCSENNTSSSSYNNSGTGSYTCSLAFPDNDTPASSGISNVIQVNCTNMDIENIVFSFFNSNDNPIHGPSTFNCELHYAKIDGIPVGLNYYAIIRGVSPLGVVMHQGRDDDVDIVENDLDDGGQIIMIQQCVDEDGDGFYVKIENDADCGMIIDCDDNDETIYQGCGTVMNWYRDFDGDGYGNPDDSIETDSQPTGYVLDNTDCDDNDITEHPNQTWYKDVDGDGYSDGAIDTSSCTRPTNYYIESELISTSSDCNDSDVNIHPGVDENCFDKIDNDCDTYIDTDDTDCPLTYELIEDSIGQFLWYDDDSNCVCLYCNP